MGISINTFGHICFYCKHYKNTLAFYEEGLGFTRACELKDEDGMLRLTYVKVSERQFIELFPKGYTSDNDKKSRALKEFVLYVSDTGKMEERLKKEISGMKKQVWFRKPSTQWIRKETIYLF